MAYLLYFPHSLFGTDYQAAYNHFLTYGINEGRVTSKAFDVKGYLALYPDLTAAFTKADGSIDYAGATNHYMNYGINEGRLPGGDVEITIPVTPDEPTGEHVWELTKTISTATCKYDGEGIFACKDCGAEERRVIPASPEYHDYQKNTEKSNAAGVDVYVCSRCNDTKVSLPEGVAHVHNYVEEITSEATCTKTGIKTFTCISATGTCSRQVYTETIPMKDHESDTEVGAGFVITKAVKCTSDGLERVQCKNCYTNGSRTMFTRVIPAHNYDDGVITTEPTCTKAGVKTYTCKDCGATKTEEVEALKHDYADVKAIEIVAPTCEKTGVEVKACRRCGESTTTIIKALGHKKPAKGATYVQGYAEVNKKTGEYLVEATITDSTKPASLANPITAITGVTDATKADCENDLIDAYACVTCGELQVEVVATKLGHTVDTSKEVREGIATIDINSVIPNKATNVYVYKNPVTGERAYDYIEDADGIVFEDGKKVDCSHEKVKIFTCVNCKKVQTEVVEARKAHTGNVNNIPATCTEPGYKVTSCTTCENIVKEATTEKAVGHSFKYYDETCTDYAAVKCERCQVTPESILADTENGLSATEVENLKKAWVAAMNIAKPEGYTVSSETVASYTAATTGDSKYTFKGPKEHAFIGDVTPTTTPGKATVWCKNSCCSKYVTVDYTAPVIDSSDATKLTSGKIVYEKADNTEESKKAEVPIKVYFPINETDDGYNAKKVVTTNPQKDGFTVVDPVVESDGE